MTVQPDCVQPGRKPDQFSHVVAHIAMIPVELMDNADLHCSAESEPVSSALNYLAHCFCVINSFLTIALALS